MAKISPASIKYMVHANFRVEGALEKPDIIGAIFGQTEGLLGSDLEMRELQKEGKIGRIEVEIERKDKITTGKIQIPTALDQSETTLIAAAIETIEKIGPCDSQVDVERIEDVRGSKREYIIERAKKLMMEVGGKTDSREISRAIKDSARISGVKEYGEEKLPYGDLSEQEIIVVEGRADVLNLLRKLIIQNVIDNARIKQITVAPDGKEVEELTGKELLMCLRKKIPVKEFLVRGGYPKRSFEKEERKETLGLNDESKKKLKEISEKNKGTGKAIFLDSSLKEIKSVSIRALITTLKKMRKEPFVIIIDGTATISAIKAAEESGIKALVAKNFTTTDTKIELLSF